MRLTLKPALILLSSFLLLGIIGDQMLGAASTKARTFNGTSDNLQSAAAINLTAGSIITVAFRLWIDSDTADPQIILETSADSTMNDGAFAIYTNATGNLYVGFTGGGFAFGHITRPSTGAWHQYFFVMDNSVTNSPAVTARVDGAGATFTWDTTTITAATFGNHTLNVMARNGGAGQFTPGRISEIAIWTSGLTTGNGDTYTVCGDPGAIDTVDFWWPIVQASPETASAGGVNLTVGGTTNSDSPCLGGAPRARNCALLGVC